MKVMVTITYAKQFEVELQPGETVESFVIDGRMSKVAETETMEWCDTIITDMDDNEVWQSS